MKEQNTDPALIFVNCIRQLKGTEYFVNSPDHNNMLVRKLTTDMRFHGGGCREGGSGIDLKQKKKINSLGLYNLHI